LAPTKRPFTSPSFTNTNVCGEGIGREEGREGGKGEETEKDKNECLLRVNG